MSTSGGGGRPRAGVRRTIVVLVASVVLAAACTSDPPAAAPGATNTTSATAPGATAAGSVPEPAATGTTGTTPRSGGTALPSDVFPVDDAPVAPLDWRRCDALECATISVPLDYHDLDGETIKLSVVRRKATRPASRVGSLFINPGGPGASGIEFVQSGAPGRVLSADFDIVSWDPRGVGTSSPIVCNAGAVAYRDLDWSPDDDRERRELDDAAEEIADDCNRKAGELLHHVSTDYTARDLDRLRRAVGDDKLSYLGFSYGTHIGERYAELFPTKVRAMVLDGVVDPTANLSDLLYGQAEALEKQMKDLFAECETRPSCPLDDAASAYDELAEQVEREPMGTGAHKFGPTALAFAAVASSYTPGGSEAFLAGLDDALAGDESVLKAMAINYFESGAYSSYLAILCTDTPRPTNGDEYTALEERLASVSPRFGAAVANEVRPCAFWDAPAVTSVDPVRAAGSAPILVVGNTGDVATPYVDAKKVAEALDNGVLLTHNGAGHTSYGKSACVDAIINTYLISLEVPDEGTECG